MTFGPSGLVRRGLSPRPHSDPIDGLLAQVTGRKRVWMAPACAAPNVYNHVGVFSQVDFRRVDYDRFPLMRNVGIIECDRSRGPVVHSDWLVARRRILDVSASVRFGHVKWNTHFETPHPPLRPPS